MLGVNPKNTRLLQIVPGKLQKNQSVMQTVQKNLRPTVGNECGYE
jgi:hypothetical protein